MQVGISYTTTETTTHQHTDTALIIVLSLTKWESAFDDGFDLAYSVELEWSRIGEQRKGWKEV